LSSLAVEDLPMLSSLSFKDNKYETVTLKNLPSLYDTGEIWQSSFGYVHNLTLTNLPTFTSLMLRDLQIRAISISAMPNLTFIDLTDNELSTIDLSGIPSLTELSLPNNKLTSIDLSKNVNLTSLDVSRNQLT